MLPLKVRRASIFAFAVICLVPSLSGVIAEIRQWHGKQIQCLHSGLRGSGGKVCGTFGYARVFTGTVRSAVDVSDTDKRLELIPEEIFLGNADEATARVNQACLPINQPEIKAGDRWLFYLQSPGFPGTSENVNELILPYDSPSGPMSSEQEELSKLRHLAQLTDSGLLTGRITRMAMLDQKVQVLPASKWTVTAVSKHGGVQYSAVTDAAGYFELELIPDSYTVSANTQAGVQASMWLLGPSDADTFLEKHGCTETDFQLHADGTISGRVTKANGEAARETQVAILQVSPWPEYFTVTTDDHGRFEVRGRDPGQYFVGAGMIAHTVTEWPLRVYYPGVQSRAQAKPIDLGMGEQRTDINFILPADWNPQ